MSMGELTAADVAAVTNHGGSGWGGFGGENGWWVIILLLAFGGCGFGGYGGGGIGENYALATDFATLERKLDGVNNGICDATFALNNTITQGFYNTISSQKDCCCQTQRLIEQGFCDLKENANNNTRAILDFLTNEKIESLRDENQTLKLAASQARQNNYLISELRPAPVPAYTVQNPYCCNTGCGCGNYGNF